MTGGRQRLLARIVSVAVHAAALGGAALVSGRAGGAGSGPAPAAGPVGFAPYAPEPVFREETPPAGAPLFAADIEALRDLRPVPPDLAEPPFAAPAPVPVRPAALPDPPLARAEALCPRPAFLRRRPARPAGGGAKPSPAPARPGPRRKGPDVRATVRRLPEPEYPARCRAEGHEGSVTLEIQVLATGRPGCIRVKRRAGCADLVPAATEAARRATFFPALRGGRPVASWATVTYRFRIE